MILDIHYPKYVIIYASDPAIRPDRLIFAKCPGCFMSFNNYPKSNIINR